MIPTAISKAGDATQIVMASFLGGILFFFIVEKLVIWRHCHDTECVVTGEAAGPVIIIGDAFHNFVDGIVIAASFLVDFSFGIAISLTVIAHEVPQEIGDLAILVDKKYSTKKAFVYNTISGLTTVPAAIIAYFILEQISIVIPYILAISASSFLYIALSDLTPELHQKLGLKHGLGQLVLILAGITTMVLIFMLKSVI
ncbi:MAG: ZIP family metal transporter [Candidatus Thorarchaeota archaeon]